MLEVVMRGRNGAFVTAVAVLKRRRDGSRARIYVARLGDEV
jgi:hypothetical protein